MIAVRLPFSRGELYDEQLVNISYVNSCFEKHDFKIVKYGSFEPAEFEGESAKNKGRDHRDPIAALNKNDKEWVSLYSYCVLEKQ